MKNFQQFVSYYLMLKEQFEKNGMEEIDIHIKDKKYYKKAGITDLDVIRQLEHRKTKEMNDRIYMNVQLINEYGSVYEISDEVMRYILLNKPPQDREILKKLYLPFKSIFIETEITDKDCEIGVNNIRGILINQTKMISTKEDSKGLTFDDLGRIFMVYYLCIDEQKLFIDEFKMDIEKNSPAPIVYDDNKTYRFLNTFIINFLLFINDPEVELVHHKRDEVGNRRRMGKGKMPLPSSRVVRITGRLKKYVDGLRGHLGKGRYSVRFWVAGHSRLLSSDRYTKMRGQIIRLEPYLKGQGVLLQRTYSLDFEKKDVRCKEVKEGILDYNNIKPKSI